MPPDVLFIIDKPQCAASLYPLLRQRYPQERLAFVPILLSGFYAPRFPEGLATADYPAIFAVPPQVPLVRHAFLELNPEPMVGLADAGAVKLEWARDWDACEAAVRAAPVVVCLSSATMVAEAMCQHLRGHGLGSVPLRALPSLDPNELSADLGRVAESSFEHGLRQNIGAHAAKAYFDFQFACNSKALLTPLLRAYSATGAAWVSKYQFLLLHALHAFERRSMGEWLIGMDDWHGSGTFPPAPLGSAASRATLFEQLTSHGWIEGPTPRVSARGYDALACLPPGTFDVDLPQRLVAWQRRAQGESLDFSRAVRAEMDAYLRQWFGLVADKLAADTSSSGQPAAD